MPIWTTLGLNLTPLIRRHKSIIKLFKKGLQLTYIAGVAFSRLGGRRLVGQAWVSYSTDKARDSGSWHKRRVEGQASLSLQVHLWWTDLQTVDK